MKVKVTGLDGFMKELAEVQKAFGSTEEKIAELRFSPDDPHSIQAAIAQMEAAVDEKTARYRSNPLVMQLGNGMKETYRKAILDKAAEGQAEKPDIL